MNENIKQITQGEKYTLKLMDITHSGEGLGRIDNMIVFVEGGLPGDVVEVEIEKDLC